MWGMMISDDRQAPSQGLGQLLADWIVRTNINLKQATTTANAGVLRFAQNDSN
jgi:hypothetical protein